MRAGGGMRLSTCARVVLAGFSQILYMSWKILKWMLTTRLDQSWRLRSIVSKRRGKSLLFKRKKLLRARLRLKCRSSKVNCMRRRKIVTMRKPSTRVWSVRSMA